MHFTLACSGVSRIGGWLKMPLGLLIRALKGLVLNQCCGYIVCMVIDPCAEVSALRAAYNLRMGHHVGHGSRTKAQSFLSVWSGSDCPSLASIAVPSTREGGCTFIGDFFVSLGQSSMIHVRRRDLENSTGTGVHQIIERHEERQRDFSHNGPSSRRPTPNMYVLPFTMPRCITT
jgi:hypothetical protein